jgi:hypothetical protein
MSSRGLANRVRLAGRSLDSTPSRSRASVCGGCVASARGLGFGLRGVAASDPIEPPPTEPQTAYTLIPEAHWAAIARAIASWAELELLIDRGTWHLLGVDQALAACLTSQFNSVFARLDALSSLAEVRTISKPSIDALTKISGSLGDLNQTRNRLVHDARYVRENGSVNRFRVTAKSLLRFELEQETPGDLLAFQAKVDAKRQEFLAIWQKVRDEFESTPAQYRLKTPRRWWDVPGLPGHPSDTSGQPPSPE